MSACQCRADVVGVLVVGGNGETAPGSADGRPPSRLLRLSSFLHRLRTADRFKATHLSPEQRSEHLYETLGAS